MKRRYLYGLGLLSAMVVLGSAVPAMAAARTRQAPDISVSWSFGPSSPFNATRFDGAYVASLNRVYFLGFRTDGDATDGSVWYLDLATSTYVDTGVDMPIPISNYQISALTDSHGLGLYIFGGRNSLAQIVKATQVYYPADNMAKIVTSDPFPGTTPSGCVSLPAMGVATLANRAFVLGGVAFVANGCVADENSAQTWIFNPMAAAGARWTAGPPLNLARGYITPAVLNGRIYAIGGDINTAGSLTAQTIVEAWKPPTGGWNDAAVADLPEMCDESQAFTVSSPSGKFIVMASCGQWPNGNGHTNVYDPVANSWSPGGAIKDVVRNEAGEMIKVAGKPRMFILGGYDEASTFLNPVNVSEIGKAGALSGAQDAPTHVVRATATTAATS